VSVFSLNGKSRDIAVVVVAKPGRVRDGLGVLLKTIPHLTLTGYADDGTAGLQMVTTLRPEVVLLDVNLPDSQVWTLLPQIKRVCPETHCIVLVDLMKQQQQAELSGADAVLLKGFATSEIFVTIKNLLYPETASADGKGA
jgi:DNA-binding NarL/FixJ family response regulator